MLFSDEVLDESLRPVASQHLRIEEAGGHAIITDETRREFHFLNETAYSILKACTGANTLTDISATLRFKFRGADPVTVITDVRSTMSELRSKGLIYLVVDGRSYQHGIPAELGIGHNELLAVYVAGSNMFPVLIAGETVLLQRSSAAFVPGDIVVTETGGREFSAGRIAWLDLQAQTIGLTLQSAPNGVSDSSIAIDQLLGKVVAVLRENGVQWMTDLDTALLAEVEVEAVDRPGETLHRGRAVFHRMQVLDLRDISPEFIRRIESVEDVGTVLLSPHTAPAWSDVAARNVSLVVEVAENYRVYTGQPEILPEILEGLDRPMALLVVGQLFLTECSRDQILHSISDLMLFGQAYVSDAEAKAALETVLRGTSGQVVIVPRHHIRWIGDAFLGPEYLTVNAGQPLCMLGNLRVADRMRERLGEVPVFPHAPAMAARANAH